MPSYFFINVFLDIGEEFYQVYNKSNYRKIQATSTKWRE